MPRRKHSSARIARLISAICSRASKRRFPALDAVRAGHDRRSGQVAFAFNPFDLTKVWPKGEFPLIEVGYFELNRNPENYLRRGRAGRRSLRPMSCPASASRPTRCCRHGCSPTATRLRYRLGVNHHHDSGQCAEMSVSTAIIATARCGRTAIWAEHPPTSQTAAASRIDQPDLNEPPLDDRRRSGTLGSSRRRRSLSATRQSVPQDEPGPAAGPVRQHGTRRQRGGWLLYPGTTHRQLRSRPIPPTGRRP